jgi:hypothetical protein
VGYFSFNEIGSENPCAFGTVKTSIPEFIFISEGDVQAVNILDKIAIKKTLT